MSRSTLGGIGQGHKRTVGWSDGVADNSKPPAVDPRKGMTDDEALRKSGEMAAIRFAKKQTQAQASASRHENFDAASSSKPFIGFAMPVYSQASQASNSKTSLGIDQQSNGNTSLQAAFNSDRVKVSLSENEKKLQRAYRFGGAGQESTFNVDPLAGFTVEQAEQISKLSEDEKKRQRSSRFGTQSLQNLQFHKSKVEISKELELLGTIVEDFFDTAKLYAQVQDAISETSSEMTLNELGRTRAWDYFDDGFKVESKAESRVESKIESLIDYQENSTGVLEDSTEKVNESELILESDSALESNDILFDTVNVDAKVVEIVDDLPLVPDVVVSDQNEESSDVTSVHHDEETIADRNDDSDAVIDKLDTDIAEEELVPSYRFSTVCDLRGEVLSPPLAPSQSQREKFRQEIALKRKSVFKKSAMKVINYREPAIERSRRRKDRLALFDANRASSITAVFSELDLVVNLDTPTERLFRLEHPEYFPKESAGSREERLHEYERARSAYDAHVVKLMAKQEKSQEKVVRKRLRELENEELLQEAKKVARQKVQEEMGWTPPSDTEIWKWREERGKLPSAQDEYDEKESDEENNEYYDTFEESLKPLGALRPSLRRNEKVLSYSELRRQVRERERNKKTQSELAKIQETARKCQIEDLRQQVLEEERIRRRQKLVDLSNERDKRDAKTVQYIREVAASKIVIGRAIRELENKIAEAEAQLSRKRRLENMVNDQLLHMKCIRYEELQNGKAEVNHLSPESIHKTL